MGDVGFMSNRSRASQPCQYDWNSHKSSTHASVVAERGHSADRTEDTASHRHSLEGLSALDASQSPVPGDSHHVAAAAGCVEADLSLCLLTAHCIHPSQAQVRSRSGLVGSCLCAEADRDTADQAAAVAALVHHTGHCMRFLRRNPGMHRCSHSAGSLARRCRTGRECLHRRSLHSSRLLNSEGPAGTALAAAPRSHSRFSAAGICPVGAHLVRHSWAAEAGCSTGVLLAHSRGIGGRRTWRAGVRGRLW